MKIAEEDLIKLLMYLERSCAVSQDRGGLSQSSRKSLYQEIMSGQSKEAVEVDAKKRGAE